MTTQTTTTEEQTTVENISQVADAIGKLAEAGMKEIGEAEAGKHLGKVLGTPGKVAELAEAMQEGGVDGALSKGVEIGVSATGGIVGAEIIGTVFLTTNPYGLAISAIVGGFIADTAYTDSDLQKSVDSMIDDITDTVSDVATAVGNFFDSLFGEPTTTPASEKPDWVDDTLVGVKDVGNMQAKTELTKEQLEALDPEAKAKVEKLKNQIDSIENDDDIQDGFPGVNEEVYASDSKYDENGYDQYDYDIDGYNKWSGHYKATA